MEFPSLNPTERVKWLVALKLIHEGHITESDVDTGSVSFMRALNNSLNDQDIAEKIGAFDLDSIALVADQFQSANKKNEMGSSEGISPNLSKPVAEFLRAIKDDGHD